MVPIKTHVLKKGETYAGVLKKAGFGAAAAKAIYTRYNPALKKAKPDPKSLEPGDEIRFPAVTKAQLEAAWTTIFDARVKMIDPLVQENNMLVKRLGTLKKMAADAKALAAEQTKMLKMRDIKWVNPLQKQMETCRKDLRGAHKDMSIGEMAKCITVIGDYYKLLNEMKAEIDIQIRDVEAMAARQEQMLTDTQTRITQLGQVRALIDVTFDKALNPIAKMIKDTY